MRGISERVYRRCPRVKAIEEDPADDAVLACGLRAKADCIVSKDSHLLSLGEFRGTKIVGSDEFLKLIGDTGIK